MTTHIKPGLSQIVQEVVCENRLPARIFVTGTDTGIGKTLVSAILTIGLKAHYWKPVQSGNIEGTDREWIETVSQLPKNHFLPEVYSLRAPLSPHAAAQLEDVQIDMKNFHLPQISPLIVEGAGGIMVPLNKDHYVIDLIKQLSMPVIVVARSGLGTINHTLLSLDKLRTEGVPVLGVVMNGVSNKGNREALEHYGQVEILAEIPPLDCVSHDSLQELFENNFASLKSHNSRHYFANAGTSNPPHTGTPIEVAVS